MSDTKQSEESQVGIVEVGVLRVVTPLPAPTFGTEKTLTISRPHSTAASVKNSEEPK